MLQKSIGGSCDLGEPIKLVPDRSHFTQAGRQDRKKTFDLRQNTCGFYWDMTDIKMGTLAVVPFLLIATHLGLTCGQYRPLNIAALLGSNVEFSCTKPPNNGIITWNIFPMSQRATDSWPESTVAIAGNVILSQSKYAVSTSGSVETLQLLNVTHEDAAVVECHGIHAFRKQAQLVILEPPVCTKNVTGDGIEYIAGEFVSFTCKQDFHQDIWAPRMLWSWVSPNALVPSVNETDGTKAEYAAVVEMVPEYNGRQLKCDIAYDPLPIGTYPAAAWDFATNVPTYRHRYTTPGGFAILYEVRNFEIKNRKLEYNPGDVIICTAEGNPTPRVQWFVAKGAPVMSASATSGFTVITILTVTAGMAGTHSYTCNASNHFGDRHTVLSDTIDFTVIKMMGN